MAKAKQFYRGIIGAISLFGMLHPALAATPYGHTFLLEPTGTLVTSALKNEIVEANLFDLSNSSILFTRTGNGYTAKAVEGAYTTSIGSAHTAASYRTSAFTFNFSGANRNEFFISQRGLIAFDSTTTDAINKDIRFARMIDAPSKYFPAASPVITPFFNWRLSGTMFVNELTDRLIITWRLTEPFGGIFDFANARTTNNFQAVLFRDGSVQFNFETMQAKDGIVGVFPAASTTAPDLLESLGTATDPEDPSLAGYLDVTRVTAHRNSENGLSLVIQLRDNIPVGANVLADNLFYRAYLDTDAPYTTTVNFQDSDAQWSARGSSTAGYSGTGTNSTVKVYTQGNTVRLDSLVTALANGGRLAVFFSSQKLVGQNQLFDQSPVLQLDLPQSMSGTPASEEVDLSKAIDGKTFKRPHEIFHHLSVDSTFTSKLICDAISSVGDVYDFYIFYSQFRVDQQEAGTPTTVQSNNIQGIGKNIFNNQATCNHNKFKSNIVWPIFIDALQGFPNSSAAELGPFNFAMSQIAHEITHTWSFNPLTVKLGGVDAALSDGGHWVAGLNLDVPFPWYGTNQASLMGGGKWQENNDGTFTQLADNFFVPASGFSYYDLYMMGLMTPEEVPATFLISNLQLLRRDSSGRGIYSGSKSNVTINDVINSYGQRVPSAANSQKIFRTAFIYVTAPGEAAAADKLARVTDIRKVFSDFWFSSSGQRSMMNTDVNHFGLLPSFDGATNTLTLPLLEVSGTFYKATLSLVKSSPIELQLTSLTPVDPGASKFISRFRNGQVELPELQVGGTLYTATFSVVATNPVTLRLANLAQHE